MTVQITRAHAKALLAMFRGEHAEDILELDHGNHGELWAEWLNHPETSAPVLAAGLSGPAHQPEERNR